MIVKLADKVTIAVRVKREISGSLLVTVSKEIDSNGLIEVTSEILNESPSLLLIGIDTANVDASQYTMIVSDDDGELANFICSFINPQNIKSHQYEFRRSEHSRS